MPDPDFTGAAQALVNSLAGRGFIARSDYQTVEKMVAATFAAWGRGLYADGVEAAAAHARASYPAAHTYASENADRYIVQDAVVDTIIKNLRQLATRLRAGEET